MSDTVHLGDLPEAVPLTRVAPGWRLLAILLVIISAGLFLVVFVLGYAVVEHLWEDTTAAVPVAPPAPMATTTAVSVDPPLAEPVDPKSLPYPVTQDPRTRVPSTDPKVARETPRSRFLRWGQEVWKNPPNQFPTHVVVSPDGQELAYIHGENLIAGNFSNPQAVADPSYYNPAMQSKPTGIPTWSVDGDLLFFADRNGQLRSCDRRRQHFEKLSAFEGDSPAIVPNDPDKLVFIRSLPVVKIETPGVAAANDQTEVVLANYKTQKTVRTLVPLSTTTWTYPSLSPDGKRLALVSDRDSPAGMPSRLRVFVIDVASGKANAITSPAFQVGPVCWTPDGNALIYARSSEQLLPDHWEGEHGQGNRPTDLFLWDFKTNRETRLSRGGGFSSPSISQKTGELFFLVRKIEPAGISLRLRSVPLDIVRKFAQQEPEPVVRDAAAWTLLMERVLTESQVAADSDGETLTPEVLSKLTSNFEQFYLEQFKAEPPETLAGFQRLGQELALLTLPLDVRPRFLLVLGAVRGEYLRRQHNARWLMAKGPLVSSTKLDAASRFGYAVNPFQTQIGVRSDGDGRLQWPRLEDILLAAEGRTLVLSNDTMSAQAALESLIDPDLAKAVELFKQNMGGEAEKILVNLMQRPPHDTNYHLALCVGQLFYEHNRKVALEQLMEEQCRKEPRDARKFNLLGVSQLMVKPGEAIDSFKNALRCDLHFGPAYLNLAQAYEKCARYQPARECLLRYLELMPHGAQAADARRRLSVIKNDNRDW